MRIRLRHFMLALSLLAVVVCHHTYGLWRSRVVVERLKQRHVWCYLAPTDELPWYDRLPWGLQRQVLQSVYLTPEVDVASVIPLLKAAQTPEIEYYNISLKQLGQLSTIPSIRVLRTNSFVDEAHARVVRRFAIQEFWVEGSDNNPTDAALEQLFEIQSLKRLGTAHGPAAVPDSLKQARPDIEIDQTDFPA